MIVLGEDKHIRKRKKKIDFVAVAILLFIAKIIITLWAP